MSSASPHPGSSWRVFSAVAVAALGGACGVNNPTYFSPPMGALDVGAGAGAPQEATAVVTIPFRLPTDKEVSSLEDRSAALGFQVPWLARDQVALSIQYTVTNLDAEDGTAQVLVNGANELTSYDPQAIRAAALVADPNNNELVVLSLIQPTPVIVRAGQTISGLIREDDFAEAALDLDAIGRWMAPPAAVLINASEVNPVGLEAVPAQLVVPALFRVSVTFTATRHMRLDFLVRVRDHQNQLLQGSGDAFTPQPAGYTPPPPPMP